MSFVSTGVEYGLHCLLYLVESHGGGVRSASARDLAEMQGVSVDYVAKLFTKLSHAGLVTASEGVRGGFSLARPAETITVNDVVVAIDGDKPMFDCREVRRRCALFEDEAPAWAHRGPCAIHSVMVVAEQAMRDELGRHTLADLVDRAHVKSPAKHGAKVVEWFAARSATRGARA
jgi:Rrf2 family protein